MTQKPADTGRGHGILRQMVHCSEFRYEDNYSDPTGNAWQVASPTLQKCMKCPLPL